MTNDKEQWSHDDESQRILNTQNGGGERVNEEDHAENDKRGIDNPELNRDQDSDFDKDRDFDQESEDENDDLLTNGLDDNRKSQTDDEDYDDDPNQTKPDQQRTGTETSSDPDRL